MIWLKLWLMGCLTPPVPVQSVLLGSSLTSSGCRKLRQLAAAAVPYVPGLASSALYCLLCCCPSTPLYRCQPPSRCCLPLQCRNVLLKSAGSDARGFVAKVSDFGLSVRMDPSETHVSNVYQVGLNKAALRMRKQ